MLPLGSSQSDANDLTALGAGCDHQTNPRPVSDNPRHERFAQELANGVSATEAYERAGFARNRVSAHRLKQKPNIGERVSELFKQREHINAQATAKAIKNRTNQGMGDRAINREC